MLPLVTPYEKFWGFKPDLSQARAFGCLGYVFRHKEERHSKWDATSVPAVMVGFADHHSAYMMEIIDTKEIKIARNVMFFEEIFPYRVSPSTEIKWINPRDLPAIERTNRESGDPFASSIRDPDEELRNLYKKAIVQPDGYMESMQAYVHFPPKMTYGLK